MNSRSLLLPAIALLCAAAGFFTHRWWTQSTDALRATTVVTPTRSTLAASLAPAPARSIPETIPELKLKNLQGEWRALGGFKGAPTIYNFWATWCVPCRREIPLLNQLFAKHRAERLQLVGIAVDFPKAVQEFLKTTPMDYTVLTAEQDGAETAARFGMELVLPFTVFASSTGQVVAVKVGELHAREANAILEAVGSVEAGRIALPEARRQIAAQLQQFSVERAATGR